MKKKKVVRMIGKIEIGIENLMLERRTVGRECDEILMEALGIVSKVGKAYLEGKGKEAERESQAEAAMRRPRLNHLEKGICDSLGAAWASRDNVLQEARIIDLWDGKPEFDSESGYYGLEGHLLATIYGMDFSLMPGQCVRVGEEGMAARDSVPSGKESRHGDCDGRREKCK